MLDELCRTFMTGTSLHERGLPAPLRTGAPERCLPLNRPVVTGRNEGSLMIRVWRSSHGTDDPFPIGILRKEGGLYER
jgi:hypothetical protein